MVEGIELNSQIYPASYNKLMTANKPHLIICKLFCFVMLPLNVKA